MTIASLCFDARDGIDESSIELLDVALDDTELRRHAALADSRDP